MSMLTRYIKECKETRGIYHMFALRTLRRYLKSEPEEHLIDAISEITNDASLRILVEAGLKPPLMAAILRRSEELRLRRRGV